MALGRLGDKLCNYDLMFFEDMRFYDISQKTDLYFMYREMKERSINGIKHGLIKNFRIRTFGVVREKLGIAAYAFKEILQKYIFLIFFRYYSFGWFLLHSKSFIYPSIF